jgi:hypothetical protein
VVAVSLRFRLVLTVVNTIARGINWALETKVDPRVCDWANTTGGDDE